jgi:hypothetical protein
MLPIGQNIQVVFSIIALLLVQTMPFLHSVMMLTHGWSKIHGEQDGEKMASSD